MRPNTPPGGAISSPSSSNPRTYAAFVGCGQLPTSECQTVSSRAPEISAEEPEILDFVPVLEKTTKSETTAQMDIIPMLLMTASSFRIQCVWSLLMSYGTLYLHELGFSSTMTPLVWLAGPLSGTFFQPLIGAHSDQCTSHFRRRKPYIIWGMIGTTISLLGLANAEEMVQFFFENNWDNHNEGARFKPTAKLAAIFWCMPSTYRFSLFNQAFGTW
jgi:hypothetical protein